MKKVLIGCGVILAVLTVLAAVGGFFAFRMAKGYFDGYAELAEIPTLNQQIQNQRTYRAPADGKLTSQQVDAYMGVLQQMRTVLGQRFTELEKTYEQLAEQLKEEQRDLRIREALSAWSDIIGLLMEGKRAQVDALNAAGMSLEEYYWIRTQTLFALGHGAFGWNLEALATDPGQAWPTNTRSVTPSRETLQHNRELLAPHEDTLDDWLAFSFFGL